MKCTTCNDQRIVWDLDKYGNAVSSHCPKCNSNGDNVRKETEKLERSE